MKRINSFIFLIFISLMSHAQYSNLNFEHINYDENFSQSKISNILQSEKGFIWLGTYNGLVRYDGYNFLRFTYKENIAGSISNNHINTIFEDSDNDLLIGTTHGVNILNSETHKFLPIDIQPIKGGRNYISSIIEDEYKNVWIGTFGGVKKLNKEEKTLENTTTDANSQLLNNCRVLSMFYDNDLGVFIGTSKGIQIFNPKTGILKELPEIFKTNPSFLKAKIQKIVKDSAGNLWFATETMGVFYYIKKQNKITNYTFKNDNTIASNWVNDILLIDENTVWFATNDGLSVLKKDTNTIINYNHNPSIVFSLSDNSIKCLYRDKQESVWLGTIAGGLNFFNQANSNFSNIKETFKPNFGLNNGIVNALVEEKNDAIWVGTLGGGINYLDFKNRKSYSYLINSVDRKKTCNMVISLASLSNDNLICGTENGLFDFNKRTKKFNEIHIFKNNLDSDKRPITSILIDEEDIWVGTNGIGLKKISEDGYIESFLVNNSINAISDNFITDLENRTNGIWIATQNGLNYLDKETKNISNIFRHKEGYSLSSNNLTDLFTDSKGRLWIGTENNGLNYFDEGSQRFHTINSSVGFIDEEINSISEDAEGNLWISSEGRLYRIQIKNFNPPFKNLDLDILLYSSKDGLSVKQFSNSCSLKLSNNDIIFGASKGLTIFNPQDIVIAPSDNNVVLTQLRINNKVVGLNTIDINSPLKNNISNTSEITLNNNQGYLEIVFSALNFVNPQKNRYSYKLDTPFNNDTWHDLGVQNTLSLNDLRPGNYTLSIKTSSKKGIWSTKIKTLNIDVLPPWWKTWWAYLLYFCVFLIISFLVFRFINHRVVFKRALFLEHLERERQEELYQMKLDFFTNVSHEIRTPLTLISGPVEELINTSDDNVYLQKKLTTIKNNSDRLLKLVNELLDFRKAEKGSLKIYCEELDIVSFCFDIYDSFRGVATKKKIDYKFVININLILVYFDKNQMEKVIYNLLSNAFKFTKNGGKITLSVEQRNSDINWIDIKIKDNGIGIPEDCTEKIFNNFFQVDDRGIRNQGSGIGLALSKKIVELHHGEISVTSKMDLKFPTIFNISLKKGKSQFELSQLADSSNFLDEPTTINNNKLIEPIENLEEEVKIEENNSSKSTIVVIDDNEELLSYLYDVLCTDYNILKFNNGHEALLHMKNEIPDIIISDVMMPEMDGYELCKILKEDQSTNHIPLILLTAKSSTQNRVDGLSIGADLYISKPFSIEVLKLNIINILSSKEILRQKYSGSFIVDSDLENLSSPEEIFIKKLMTTIESNIENPSFDVNELVNLIGMSRTVLYKKVQALTSHSVASLIKHIRLKKAAQILKSTNYPVSEVTFMVGFNDRKHFSKEFKKVYKLSPTVYKNTALD